MTARALFLLPDGDFDPTEAAVPWNALRRSGVEVHFATPSGEPSSADERLLTTGFGPLSSMIMPPRSAIERYRDSEEHPERGFTVRDRNCVSGRWPGQCHALAVAMLDLLGTRIVS